MKRQYLVYPCDGSDARAAVAEILVAGCAQVGDYVDTLLLPSSGMKNATVRWIPGPVEITGAPFIPY